MLQKTKKVKLISVSFPGRDLSLALVSLKSFAMKDKEVRDRCSISLCQFDTRVSEDEMFEKLLNSGDNIFCFSVYVWNFHKIMAVARNLKERNPKLKIIMGGPEAGGMAEKILKKYRFVDVVFVGDGEIAFREFLKTDELDLVPNAVYRREGSIVRNSQAELKNFDEIDLHHESKDYIDYLEKSPGPVRAAIETSRGCPFSCRYCSWGGQKTRYFDLEKIKPALDFLLKHPMVSLVYLTDSNPFLKKERGKKLLEFIIKHNIHNKPVVFELNPEYMKDKEILRLIAKMQNDEFAFGVQSTSPKVLKKINRAFNAERYQSNINLIRKVNPKVKMWFSVILGLPDDNYNQYLESIDYVLNMNPDGIYFHELLCLPGSDFYNHPEKYGIEFDEEAPHKLLSNKSFPKEDYDKAKRLSYFIYLVQRVPSIQGKLKELYQIADVRHIDIYARFFDILDCQPGIFGGNIKEIPSWFFEQHADEFLKDKQKISNLKELCFLFEEGIKNEA